jgi:hypothetical protein
LQVAQKNAAGYSSIFFKIIFQKRAEQAASCGSQIAYRISLIAYQFERSELPHTVAATCNAPKAHGNRSEAT